jgi:hypothetical protein
MQDKIAMLLAGMKRSSSIAGGQPSGGAVRNSLASVAFNVAPALWSAGIGACSSFRVKHNAMSCRNVVLRLLVSKSAGAGAAQECVLLVL